MNLPWAGIAQVVGNVAPSIAAVLGGSVAGTLTGLAVKMLTTVLGLPPDTPPLAVAQAVQDATPEQHAALRQADDTFRTHMADLAAQAVAGQVDIAKVEAANANFFVAGARPAILWILAVALAWGVVVVPVVSSLLIFRQTGLLPPPDLSVVLALLTGMLGLSGLRSVDKAKGTDIKGFGTRRDRAVVLPQAQPLPIIVPEAPRQAVAVPEPIAPVVIQPPALDRKLFFDTVRPLFGGRMTGAQVLGMNRILDHAAMLALSDVRHLAYMLATAFWETGRKMVPVEELGRGAGHAYGATGFWGRGLPQLTGEANYAKLGAHMGLDLVGHPERLLEWDVSLVALFDGMTLGMFTGRRLADFFNSTTDDPVRARAIVNGSDRAAEIAAAHSVFLAGLEAIA